MAVAEAVAEAPVEAEASTTRRYQVLLFDSAHGGVYHRVGEYDCRSSDDACWLAVEGHADARSWALDDKAGGARLVAVPVRSFVPRTYRLVETVTTKRVVS